MNLTRTEFFQELVSTGLKHRYGKKLTPKQIGPNKFLCSKAPAQLFLERKKIIDGGFVDHYLIAFWIFNMRARLEGIEFWARGATPSSIVCYCLGLTEIDPMKYGLHYSRFVNEQPPKFQFDVEKSRYDDFLRLAEDTLEAELKANPNLDIQSVRESIMDNITPVEYLSKKEERPLPKNIDDELARYALTFPDTMELYDEYTRRKSDGQWTKYGLKVDKILAPTCGIVVFQEQMLDILCQIFHVNSSKANNIRLSIQRKDTEQVEAYKKEIFSNLDNITEKKAELIWQILTSNPRAFLKAHAVSHVLATYRYAMK